MSSPLSSIHLSGPLVVSSLPVPSQSAPQPAPVRETPLTSALKNKQDGQIRHILFLNPSLADTPNSIGETPFQLAVRTDLQPFPSHAVLVIQLLLDRAKKRSSAQSALHLAASRADSAVLNTLLGHRPKLLIDTRNSAGRMPLHESVISGRFANFLKLLDNGADIVAKDNSGQNALHLACGKQGGEPFMRELIKRGIPLNEPDNKGETPLILALRQKEAEKARLLLEEGADPNCFSQENYCAITYAVLLEDSFFEFFLDNPKLDLNLRIGGCKIGGLALAAACRCGVQTAVERLFQKGVSPQDTPYCLVEAIKNSHWEIVSLLLDREVDLNVIDFVFPHDNLLGLVILNEQPSVARRLIEKGVDIHYRNQQGKSSLQLAFQQMDLETFELLLSQGVSPHFLMKENKARYACSGMRGLPERVFSALVTHWGSPESNGDLLFLLAIVCPYEKPMREALAKGFLPGKENKSGMIPLSSAAIMLNISAIKVLLEHSKAEVNRPSEYGHTPLAMLFSSMLEVRKDFFSKSGEIKESVPELKETVQLLLAAGADPDHVNPFDKSTPRLLAKKLGWESLFLGNNSALANGSATSSSSSSSAEKEPSPSVSKKRAAVSKTKSTSSSKRKKVPGKVKKIHPGICTCSVCQEALKKRGGPSAKE